MQILHSLENSFEKTSLRIKIELFLFPLIILLTLIYFLEEVKKEKHSGLDFSYGDIFKEKRVMQTPLIEIIKGIETYLSKNDIKLNNISNMDKKIQLMVNGDTLSLLKLIKFIEEYNNFSSIESLKLKNKELFLIVSFNKSYIKKKDKNTKNYLKYLQEQKKESKKYNLKAIVGKMVFINNKWYRLGEKIAEEFKIVKIKKDSVLIRKKQIQIELRLYNENI